MFIAIFSSFVQKGPNEQFVYCEVVCRPKNFTSKYYIDTDFGKGNNSFTHLKRYEDNDEKSILFDSPADVLNCFSNKGWHLHTAMVDTSDTFHYVLEKRI